MCWLNFVCYNTNNIRIIVYNCIKNIDIYFTIINIIIQFDEITFNSLLINFFNSVMYKIKKK